MDVLLVIALAYFGLKYLVLYAEDNSHLTKKKKEKKKHELSETVKIIIYLLAVVVFILIFYFIRRYNYELLEKINIFIMIGFGFLCLLVLGSSNSSSNTRSSNSTQTTYYYDEEEPRRGEIGYGCNRPGDIEIVPDGKDENGNDKEYWQYW